MKWFFGRRDTMGRRVFLVTRRTRWIRIIIIVVIIIIIIIIIIVYRYVRVKRTHGRIGTASATGTK